MLVLLLNSFFIFLICAPILYTRKNNDSDSLITNNKNLYLEDVKLQAPRVIKNMDNALLNSSNTNIYSTNTALYNIGELNADSTIFDASSYAFYAAAKKPMTISNSTITCRATNNSSTGAVYINSSQSDINITGSTINGYVYNNSSSTMTISGSTITKNTTQNNSERAVNNPGKMVLDNTSVALYIKDKSTTYGYGISNDSTNSNLTIKGNTEIKLVDESGHTISYGYGILNSGTVVVEKADILTDLSYSNNQNTFGLYNSKGTVVFKTGSIRALGRVAYGIYINSGEVTLGIPEIVGSPTYGRDTADVSLTDPFVYGKGVTTGTQNATGTGVKNIGGSFNYYDGKIMGSTSAKPEIPTKIEYLYEAIDYTDDETGHPYCILEWMREQPEDPDTTDQPDEPSNPDQP